MNPKFKPVYLDTFASGELSRRARKARGMLHRCVICPRNCRVDRTVNETGICRTGRLARVAAYHPHFGEESPISGVCGSGTIFFTWCNLMCCFCQNWDISHKGWGDPVTGGELADMMLSLQDQGCHNINFVSPSHVVPQILSALEQAVPHGLRVPLVYNSGGYDSVDTLKLLNGVIDIYMPDFKFWDERFAEAACNAPDYPETARNAVREMHRQVGDLVIDDDGTARSGLLVRHLILPDDLAGTREVMRFIHQEISPRTYVNVMSQYRPCGDADSVKGISRPVSAEEYRFALQAAREEGITRLDRWELSNPMS